MTCGEVQSEITKAGSVSRGWQILSSQFRFNHISSRYVLVINDMFGHSGAADISTCDISLRTS